MSANLNEYPRGIRSLVIFVLFLTYFGLISRSTHPSLSMVLLCGAGLLTVAGIGVLLGWRARREKEKRP